MQDCKNKMNRLKRNSKFVLISITILLIYISEKGSTTAEAASLSGHLQFNMCSKNESISVQLATKYDGTGISCQCQTQPSNDPWKDDYVYTSGIGSHRLFTQAKQWNDARKICHNEGAHLAIINSREEESVSIYFSVY